MACSLQLYLLFFLLLVTSSLNLPTTKSQISYAPTTENQSSSLCNSIEPFTGVLSVAAFIFILSNTIISIFNAALDERK